MAAKFDASKLKAGVLLQIEPENVLIQDDPKGPFFDDDDAADRTGLSENTVLNIKMIGVQHPVICARHEDSLYAVDGRRRIRHLIEANKRLKKEGDEPKLLPIIIRALKPELGNLIGVSLNEHRQDHSMLAKIRKASTMLATGYTPEQISNSFGVSPQQVENWTKVTEKCAAVQKAVEDGIISPTAASKIDGTASEQKAQLDKLTDGTAKPSAQRAARIASGSTGNKPSIVEIRDLLANAETPAIVKVFYKWVRGECPFKELEELF